MSKEHHSTAHTLEELVTLLQDGRLYYFSSDELNKLGLAEIIKHRLESWTPAYPDETHDPVDMPKVDLDESDVAITRADNLMADAQQAIRKGEHFIERHQGASYDITAQFQIAGTYAQLASAQAQFAAAYELRKIRELYER
jgi:hypothetical protein